MALIARVQIVDQQVVVTQGGIDLVAPLVERAEDAAAGAEGFVAEAEAAADRLSTRITANHFRPTDITADARLNGSGVVEFSSGDFVTDFLPVVPGITYTLVKFEVDGDGLPAQDTATAVNARWHFYDASETMLRAVTTAVSEETALTSEVFVRLSAGVTAHAGRYMLVEGTALPGVFTAWASYHLPSNHAPAPRLFEGQTPVVLGDSLSLDTDSWWKGLLSPLGFKMTPYDDGTPVEERSSVAGAAIEERPGYGVEGGTNHDITHFFNRVQYLPDGDAIFVSGGTNGWGTPANGTTTTTATVGTFATEWAIYYNGGLRNGNPTSTTTYGAMIRLCHALVTKYPNKPIYFIGPPPRTAMYDTAGKLSSLTLRDYCNALKTVCDAFGIPYFDSLTLSGLRPWDATNYAANYEDTTHLNADGQALWGQAILRWVQSPGIAGAAPVRGPRGAPGGDLSQIGTLAEAKTIDILDAQPGAEQIALTDRPGLWVKTASSMAAELEDYAWFEDAGAQKWRIQSGSVNVKQFGAAGDGVTDDTRPWHAAAIWAGLGYTAHLIVPSGTYLVADGLLSWYPAGTNKTAITSIPNFSGSNNGVAFVNCDGLLIEGAGNPVIKRADDGCTLNSLGFMSWGIFNFLSSDDARVTGIRFDGNRAGQTHTIGGGSTNVNFTLHVWGDCHRFTADHCQFYRSGTLRTSSDKGGDCIYIKSGAKNANIHHCQFGDPGRWSITCEKPSPSTATGETNETHRATFADCIFDVPFVQDGGVALGAIDVEPWSAYGYITIERCVFKGSAKISCGSAPNEASQVVRNLTLRDLVFDLRGSTAAHSADDLIGIAGAWSNPTLGISPTVRRFEGLTIDGITIYSDKALGGDIVQLTNCVIGNGSVLRGIRNMATVKGAGSGILFSSAWLEGSVIIEDHDFGLIGHGVYFNSFNDPGGTAPAHVILRNNVGNGLDWGFRGTLPALPSGSTFTVAAGNRFTNQGARTDLVATGFVSAGGVAKLERGSFFSGTGNVFTGFVVPGRGQATVLSGQTFVTVTHGLGVTPTNVVVTQRTAQTIGHAVTNIGSTTFRVTMASAPGADTIFDYRADALAVLN